MGFEFRLCNFKVGVCSFVFLVSVEDIGVFLGRKGIVFLGFVCFFVLVVVFSRVAMF